MSSSVAARRQELLAKPSHHHLVQFYDKPAFLAKSVGAFIGSGLRNQEAAVIIAKPAHREAFIQTLEADGLNASARVKNGQLLLLDAAQTLATFVVGGAIKQRLFEESMGRLLEPLRDRFPRTRAYGEMVGLLWDAGNSEATVELERLWNELAGKYSFSLLCGYRQETFFAQEHSQGYQSICQHHSHVLPTEDFLSLDDIDQKSRAIAILQQQAKSLEAELKKREQVEAELRQAVSLRDEFLSIAGHELRTPLTSLKLQVQLQQRRLHTKASDADDRKSLEKLLKISDRQINQLARLVDDMLGTSRLNRGTLNLTKEVFCLEDLVKEVVARFDEQLLIAGWHVQS